MIPLQRWGQDIYIHQASSFYLNCSIFYHIFPVYPPPQTIYHIWSTIFCSVWEHDTKNSKPSVIFQIQDNLTITLPPCNCSFHVMLLMLLTLSYLPCHPPHTENFDQTCITLVLTYSNRFLGTYVTISSSLILNMHTLCLLRVSTLCTEDIEAILIKSLA